MKIIFLDIDGVMNNLESLRFPRTKVKGSKLSYSAAHSSCVQCLNFITANTNARIVVSSTWRGIGLTVLREIFSQWGVIGETVDRTPDLSVPGFIYEAPERGAEIQEWLRLHNEVTSFVILDDGDDMGELRHRLVQTDFQVGLTRADADRAIAILNAPPTDLLVDRMFREVTQL